MKLYLVQHGEACAKDVDPERPLTDRGVQDVEHLAAFLARAGVRVERVIHSGKRRAAQTAQRLARAVAPGVEPEESGLINPNDNPKAFDWQSESWGQDCLVVGHLPFMSLLSSHLLARGGPPELITFRTGTMANLERGSGDVWRLNWVVHPGLLPGTGG